MFFLNFYYCIFMSWSVEAVGCWSGGFLFRFRLVLDHRFMAINYYCGPGYFYWKVMKLRWLESVWRIMSVVIEKCHVCRFYLILVIEVSAISQTYWRWLTKNIKLLKICICHIWDSEGVFPNVCVNVNSFWRQYVLMLCVNCILSEWSLSTILHLDLKLIIR